MKVPDEICSGVFLGLAGCFVYYLLNAKRRRHRRDFGSGIDSERAYAILDVDSHANSEAIGKAYQSLAEKHHPDNFPDDLKEQASANLMRIDRAFAMIGDEDARLKYDALVHFHDPNAPPFDEAYAHILVWRNCEKHTIADEEWNKPVDAADLDD